MHILPERRRNHLPEQVRGQRRLEARPRLREVPPAEARHERRRGLRDLGVAEEAKEKIIESLDSLPNFDRLVPGCIDADFCE